MKRTLLAGALLLALVSPSTAQTYRDSGGTVVPAFVPLNCPQGGGACIGPSGASSQYTAMSGAQRNQAATTAQTLTIPTGALYARICAVTGNMNFSDSVGDTPTTGAAPTVGATLGAGSCVFESGSTLLSAFKIINTTASTGVWNAVYFK